MKRIAVLVVGIIALCVPLATQHAAAATENVSAQDNSFSPQSLTIDQGDTVHWTNDGDNPHTVTANDDSFDSGTLLAGQSFDHTFSTAGTYGYFCEVHGQSMSGTVVVRAASSGSPPADQTDSTSGDTGSDTSVAGDELAKTGAPIEMWSLIAAAMLAWGALLDRASRARRAR
jgi:plastocyanin